MTKIKTPFLEQLLSRYHTTTLKLSHVNEQVNALRSQITELARDNGSTEDEIRSMLK